MIFAIAFLLFGTSVLGDNENGKVLNTMNYEDNNNPIFIKTLKKLQREKRDTIIYEINEQGPDSSGNNLNYVNNNAGYNSYDSDSAVNSRDYARNNHYYTNMKPKVRKYRNAKMETTTPQQSFVIGGGITKKCPKNKIRVDWKTCVTPEEYYQYYDN